MKKKICPCCKINERTKQTSKWAPWCKDCTNEKNKQRYIDNRDKELARDKARQAKIKYQLYCLKASIGCYICGEKDPRALDFHHKDPKQKSGQVMIVWHNLGKQAALEEANKCELLCANCHRKHHNPLYITDDVEIDTIVI